jgi:hypothetical protein
MYDSEESKGALYCRNILVHSSLPRNSCAILQRDLPNLKARDNRFDLRREKLRSPQTKSPGSICIEPGLAFV